MTPSGLLEMRSRKWMHSRRKNRHTKGYISLSITVILHNRILFQTFKNGSVSTRE